MYTKHLTLANNVQIPQFKKIENYGASSGFPVYGGKI